MHMRKFSLPSIAFAAFVLAASLAWSLGFEFGETKEQLKLDYKVSVQDIGENGVSVELIIADQGRLKPLSAVDLYIPSKVQPNQDGSNKIDLALSLATRQEGDQLVVRFQLQRDLAERAVISLKSSHLDGKQGVLEWYYHSIPLAEYLETAHDQK